MGEILFPVNEKPVLIFYFLYFLFFLLDFKVLETFLVRCKKFGRIMQYATLVKINMS